MTSSRTCPILISRGGLTLVEVMIALTMTLIVLGAMMTAFQFASQQMQMGRGVMEMANRLRAAEELLRDDLSNLTIDPRPYTDSTNPNGYFEIVEGPLRDLNFPLTAFDASNDGVLDGILDSNGNSVPDPIDVATTGGLDLNANSVDDRFDSTMPGNSYKGDYDDVWMGTVRSEQQPFRGRYIAPNGTITIGAIDYSSLDPTAGFATDMIESPLAEICWWTAYVDDNGNRTDDFVGESIKVYRRVLLIRPGLNLPTFGSFADAAYYLATNDISARVETFTDGSSKYYRVVANDIKDLANRQNRFCHTAAPNAFNANFGSYRYLLDRSALWALRSADYAINGAVVLPPDYNGNDIILTDVVSFDMKVFSPNAGVAIDGGVTVEPGDIGFVNLKNNSPGNVAGLGAFVDLGHVGGGWFGGYATSLSQLTYQYRLDLFPGPPVEIVGLMETVYDTWTPMYESDGLNQDGDNDGGSPAQALIDEGTNGFDNGGPAAPDDDSERETRPPYPFPVRGLKATIRLIEKNTKQIHQSSVIHSYVPE